MGDCWSEEHEDEVCTLAEKWGVGKTDVRRALAVFAEQAKTYDRTSVLFLASKNIEDCDMKHPTFKFDVSLYYLLLKSTDAAWINARGRLLRIVNGCTGKPNADDLWTICGRTNCGAIILRMLSFQELRAFRGWSKYRRVTFVQCTVQ